MKVKCPIETCDGFIPGPFKGQYRSLQHHLWQRHNYDAITEHRLAAMVSDPPKQKTWHRKEVTRTEDAATVEFKKKQLTFDF